MMMENDSNARKIHDVFFFRSLLAFRVAIGCLLFSLATYSQDKSSEIKQAGAEKTFLIQKLEILGDKELLDELKSKEDNVILSHKLHDDCVGKHLSRRDIRDLCLKYNEKLLERKYYLAYLVPVPKDYSDGILELKVQTARFGKVNFYELPAGKDLDAFKDAETGKLDYPENPFAGRFFSESQIKNQLTFSSGEPFNYEDFYASVFSLNTIPDLSLHGVLKVRELPDSEERFVDIDFLVNESVPFHAVFKVDNTGTEETEEWRASTTLQYLNLTKHYDVLSLDLSSSFDANVYSAAASYYFPFEIFSHDSSFTLFGGYSESEVAEIATGIDFAGEGYFAGGEFQMTLFDLKRHRLQASVGLVHRATENQLIALGISLPREVAFTPVKLGLDYSAKQTDFLAGRNFASYAFSTNQPGLASDGDEEFSSIRLGAKADYMIHRLQLARIQRLFGKEGKWLLYARFDGQFTDDPLVPSEQKALGGMNTIRGYKERSVLGDWGYNGTVELRTPLLDRRIISKLKTGEKPLETVQFVAFVDYGYLERHEPLPGEETDATLLGAGAGFRLSLGEYIQARVDYGIALEDTEVGDESGGRLHVSIQAQF